VTAEALHGAPTSDLDLPGLSAFSNGQDTLVALHLDGAIVRHDIAKGVSYTLRQPAPSPSTVVEALDSDRILVVDRVKPSFTTVRLSTGEANNVAVSSSELAAAVERAGNVARRLTAPNVVIVLSTCGVRTGGALALLARTSQAFFSLLQFRPDGTVARAIRCAVPGGGRFSVRWIAVDGSRLYATSPEGTTVAYTWDGQ
jgi:hypothetical protein